VKVIAAGRSAALRTRLSVSHDIADGIATHRELKLVGRVGHDIMAAATATQVKMRIAVFIRPRRLPGHYAPGIGFPFIAMTLAGFAAQ